MMIIDLWPIKESIFLELPPCVCFCRLTIMHLFTLLVDLGHIIFVFTLDVKVKLTASYLCFFSWLDVNSAQRNRTVDLLLNSLQKLLVTGEKKSAPSAVFAWKELMSFETCSIPLLTVLTTLYFVTDYLIEQTAIYNYFSVLMAYPFLIASLTSSLS